MFEMIMIIGALFMNVNEDFFTAGEANKKAGLKWEYVGTQSVPAGHVALPSVNTVTGKETIMFQRK